MDTVDSFSTGGCASEIIKKAEMTNKIYISIVKTPHFITSL